ncbi:MAG: rhodanese-like domain-containing protein [Myxococcales bacterium]|nr:rhodanese-like domain-containing protein [Myxococcales bacterium]
MPTPHLILLLGLTTVLALACGNSDDEAACPSAACGAPATTDDSTQTGSNPMPAGDATAQTDDAAASGSEAAGAAGGGASDGAAAAQAGAGGGLADMAADTHTDPAGTGNAAAPAGCDGIEPTIHNITPDELDQMLASKDFVLINVHIPYAGEIPGTDVHIPFTDIADLEVRLGSDHATKAVLYCRSGSMSLAAATDLVGLGYCQIYDLPGGMNGWTAAGFTLSQ